MHPDRIICDYMLFNAPVNTNYNNLKRNKYVLEFVFFGELFWNLKRSLVSCELLRDLTIYLFSWGRFQQPPTLDDQVSQPHHKICTVGHVKTLTRAMLMIMDGVRANPSRLYALLWVHDTRPIPVLPVHYIFAIHYNKLAANFCWRFAFDITYCTCLFIVLLQRLSLLWCHLCMRL